ncbi:hypothetical protein FJZ31_41575 [Candidatus Poribacteria bacterium]|nr:hypothetical protein [Candidatus Poribacteria bacterium]
MKLYVVHSGTAFALIDEDAITISSYHYSEAGAYIIAANANDWTWKVKAMVGGVWGEWSEIRTFSVEPVNTELRQLTRDEFMTEFQETIAPENSGRFVRLTDPIIKGHFQTLVWALLTDNLATAQIEMNALELLGVKYKLVQITNGVSAGPVYGFMEASVPGNSNYHGWGAVLIRPAAAGYTMSDE